MQPCSGKGPGTRAVSVCAQEGGVHGARRWRTEEGALGGQKQPWPGGCKAKDHQAERGPRDPIPWGARWGRPARRLGAGDEVLHPAFLLKKGGGLRRPQRQWRDLGTLVSKPPSSSFPEVVSGILATRSAFRGPALGRGKRGWRGWGGEEPGSFKAFRAASSDWLGVRFASPFLPSCLPPLVRVGEPAVRGLCREGAGARRERADWGGGEARAPGGLGLRKVALHPRRERGAVPGLSATDLQSPGSLVLPHPECHTSLPVPGGLGWGSLCDPRG